MKMARRFFRACLLAALMLGGAAAWSQNPRNQGKSALRPRRTGLTVGRLGAVDVVVQTSTAVSSTVPTVVRGWDGMSATKYAPPDTNIAVGLSQVVETVNIAYEVYDKASGDVLQSPAPIHTIFAALGAPCGTDDGGDPIVLYDQLANRWLISQLEYSADFKQNDVCIALSRTGDATGAYYLYDINYGHNLPDYPKLAVWPDGYYFTANLFRFGGTFLGGEICGMDRDSMLSGGPPTPVCSLQRSEASFLPASIDGQSLPASGEEEFLANLDANGLEFYRASTSFGNGNGKISISGPIAIAGAAAFAPDCNGYDVCVKEPPVQNGVNAYAVGLEALGDRLMYRLSYRNFGAYESLVVSHSVQTVPQNQWWCSGQIGMRWYEVRLSAGGGPVVYQQGTYAPDASTYRWMGSVAQNGKGEIALGYSISAAGASAPTSTCPVTFPGVAIAARTPLDSLGALGPETVLAAGGGSQENTWRWGDYSSMVVDPSDDCTFWYANEFIPSTDFKAFANWATHIGAIQVSACP